MDKETLLYRRPFDTDPYLTELDTAVVSCEKREDRYAVVFEQTIFFPRGGGQPCEPGTADGHKVLDVTDEDGLIVHLLPCPLEVGQRVTLRIDWATRLAHMQHHLAQHILSATFTKLYHNDTAHAHVTAEGGQIELPARLTPAEIAEGEREANRIVLENHAVTTEYYTPEAARTFPVRGKITPHAFIRLVTIEDFDVNACGGTHCRRTGELGQIVITGAKEVRGIFRIDFKTGEAAKKELSARTEHLLSIQQALGVETTEEAPEAARRTVQELHRLETVQQELRARLDESDYGLLEASAAQIGGHGVVCRIVESGDMKHYKSIADRLAKSKLITLLALTDEERVSLLFQRPKGDKTPDLGAYVKAYTADLGGKGGGSPVSAQGSVPRSQAAIDKLNELFINIKEELK